MRVLTNAAWVICSTYHTVQKTLPGAAIFGRGMLFDAPFQVDWSKIGEYRQNQTEMNTVRGNSGCIDWDYQPGNKVLLNKDGIPTKVRAGLKVNLGLSRQFIQMAQFCRAEQNLKDYKLVE